MGGLTWRCKETCDFVKYGGNRGVLDAISCITILPAAQYEGIHLHFSSDNMSGRASAIWLWLFFFEVRMALIFMMACRVEPKKKEKSVLEYK